MRKDGDVKATTGGRMRIAAALLPLVLGGVRMARAQEVTTASPCPYDRCALRYEVPWIVEGQAATRVGRVGFLSSPHLAERVSRQDSALAYALRFERRNTAGQALSAVGLVLGAGAFAWGLSGGSDTGPTVLGVGAFAFGFAGGVVLSASHRDMARAIWWYNRDLPR